MLKMALLSTRPRPASHDYPVNCNIPSFSYIVQVFSVGFRKFPKKLTVGNSTRFQYFDTITWGAWIGESVSDSRGSPNALSNKYVMSRMGFIDHARFKKIPMLGAGERISMWQVHQSGLGICYLYDAISMMAKWGFLEEPGLSESGVYKVTIFDQREQRRGRGEMVLWRGIRCEGCYGGE